MIIMFRIFLSIIIICGLVLSGCTNFSKIIHDESAGMNGSFEVIESGLPVNWLVYAPETIPTGDYDLIIDTTDAKDGNQSLKFIVRDCSPVGGWGSPGITQQYYANPGEQYKISFWIKNDGSRFTVSTGAVSPMNGEMVSIITSSDKIDDWKQYAFDYTMPADQEWDNIRFEMNILKAGTFWIDDIKIINLNGEILNPTEN